MIYNTNKYSFTNDNNMKDKIPNWMNDDFFTKLQNTSDNDITVDNIMTKLAQKYNLNNINKCECCGNILNADEVNFCKSCIKK